MLLIFEVSIFLYVSFGSIYGIYDVLNWSYLIDYIQNILAVGSLIYTYFFVYFILASYILLVAMVGAISLTLHHRRNVKRQITYYQLIRKGNNSLIKGGH